MTIYRLSTNECQNENAIVTCDCHKQTLIQNENVETVSDDSLNSGIIPPKGMSKFQPHDASPCHVSGLTSRSTSMKFWGLMRVDLLRLTAMVNNNEVRTPHKVFPVFLESGNSQNLIFP